MAKILIIDDDDQVRTMLRRTLEADGHEVDEAANGNIGISKYRSNPADLIITDIYMPEKEGLETIIELKRDYPDVRILAISGGSRDMDLDFLPVAAKLGAEKTLNKPIDRRDLLAAVNELIGDGRDGPPEANVA
jgi:YesN/AraC family two-component response regulator